MSSMNSFTRSRPSRTRNMIDWNHPGEEANLCDLTVHSHSPSWVHTAVRGIETLSMARWKNLLIKQPVVLNTLEFPSSERRSSTTGSGRTGIMLYSLIFIVTRQPYTSISFCDDNQGANPVRVAPPTSKRLVVHGANFRGENCASGGRASASQASRLFEENSKGVDGDVSQVGAVL